MPMTINIDYFSTTTLLGIWENKDVQTRLNFRSYVAVFLQINSSARRFLNFTVKMKIVLILFLFGFLFLDNCQVVKGQRFSTILSDLREFVGYIFGYRGYEYNDYGRYIFKKRATDSFEENEKNLG